MRAWPSLILSAILMLTVAGCGDAEETEPEGPEAEACEHMKQGPARAVSASSDPAQAPAVAADHHRYDIAIPADEGGRSGFVSFVSDEAGEVAFHLSTEAGLELFDASNTEVPIEETTAGSLCEQVKVIHHVMLQVGTYSLRLAPTTTDSVALIVERENAHEHHEH